MVEFLDYPRVRCGLLQEVVLVAHLTRPRVGFSFDTTSLPGHLIQCVVSGRTHHVVNGCHYDLEPNTLLWSHDCEQHVGRVTEAPWSFFNVNFLAPDLGPPPPESRVQRVGPEVVKLFKSLLDAWRDMKVTPIARESRVSGRLMELLSRLLQPGQERVSVDPVAKLWWDLETAIRRDLRRPIDLSLMEELSRRGRTSIARACQAAVGMPPMKRVKQVRLSHAWGLVMLSDLQMKEIADRVGYGRVHEFSRDYRRKYGRSPMHDRVAEREAAAAESQSKRGKRNGRAGGGGASGKTAKSSTRSS